VNRKIACIDLAGATAALLIAVGFTHTYSIYANHRLNLAVDNHPLTPACEILRDYSLSMLFLPFGALGLGIVFIVVERLMATAIICKLAWVLTIGLISLTLVAWQISFIPVF
jgi:hypothetical protein